MTTRHCLPAAALGLLILFSSPIAWSYSVLTHEAIIDSTWDSAIKPLLLKRFPAATADDLTAAQPMPTEGASSRTWAIIRSAARFTAI